MECGNGSLVVDEPRRIRVRFPKAAAKVAAPEDYAADAADVPPFLKNQDRLRVPVALCHLYPLGTYARTAKPAARNNALKRSSGIRLMAPWWAFSAATNVAARTVAHTPEPLKE